MVSNTGSITSANGIGVSLATGGALSVTNHKTVGDGNGADGVITGVTAGVSGVALTGDANMDNTGGAVHTTSGAGIGLTAIGRQCSRQ